MAPLTRGPVGERSVPVETMVLVGWTLCSGSWASASAEEAIEATRAMVKRIFADRANGGAECGRRLRIELHLADQVL